ncbi:uncharacterized protein LOC104909038 isoform X1 [Beta vulgaris subsp. vulgaris]|uniref:uncharacterized protein LOC104909038 isoform X1 n=1 Tax=Beta vulgaris subsp. vulgaris TaxID=3555 RepID=UPI00053FFA91|nr:uncharacterized protein LOC104909038 isoform X1 [Beta vulgaris subsp. vulgaris]
MLIEIIEMESSSKNLFKELFGPPPPRRPIPSKTLSTVVKIFSIFSDQNPFSQHSSYTKQSDDSCNDVVTPRGEKEASNELVGSATVEAQKLSRGGKEISNELVGSATVEAQILPVHDKTNNDEIDGDLSKEISFSGSKLIIDELGRTNTENKAMDRFPSDEEGANDAMGEFGRVHEELSGIERILMDESDDFDVLQLPDKDSNFDFLNGFSSILDTDVCVTNFITNESKGSGKMTVDGDMKEDRTGEKKRKDVEVNKLSSGGDEAKSDNHLSLVFSDTNFITHESKGSGKMTVNGDMKADRTGEKKRKDVEVNKLFSGGDEAKSDNHLSVLTVTPDCQNQYVRKKRKLCEKTSPQDLSDSGGLTFSALKSGYEEGAVSNSIRKESKSVNATKGVTEKTKDTSAKDVNSGLGKLSFIDSGTSSSTKLRGPDPVVRGKMVKQNVNGNTGKVSAMKVGTNRPKGRERFQYSREELLKLWKITSAPEDILETVREINVELQHGKIQNSAAGKISCGSNEGKLVAVTKDKMAKDKDSSILKDKKRGSSSETKKEKKKRQKRKKRAEMNKKLGVKRLKLKPLVKPKVISDCRHYLKGRCQEGENCKFSHDVIPLTKSKPCCHFARQACMKGDDCPYDHQLSSYPCNSYVAAGFCSRGDSCLFSHKIPSGTAADVSKCEPTLEQHKSDSKQQCNANASLPSEIAALKSLKEDLTKQTNQQAKAPKGLSFLSSGKSSLKDAGKHEEAYLSQKSGGAAGTSSQPNIATRTAVNLVKTLMDTPASDTSQGLEFPSSDSNSVGSLENKKQANLSVHGDHSSFHSFGKTLLQESAKYEKVGLSNRAGVAGGGGSDGGGKQLNKEMSSRVTDCEKRQSHPAPMSCKQSVPSSGGPLYDNYGGESQATLPTNGHSDTQIKEKETANGSDNAVQQKLWGSPTSIGQFSTKVGMKNTSSTSQRALLSTLAFAAKYESGIKMTSAATFKEVAKNGGSSSSGHKQNEPSKASAILDFLYSGGNKEKKGGGS